MASFKSCGAIWVKYSPQPSARTIRQGRVIGEAEAMIIPMLNFVAANANFVAIDRRAIPRSTDPRIVSVVIAFS